MATYNKTRTTHQTLVASTVDIVNLSVASSKVEVVNRGTGDIFVSVDGSTPTVGGDDTFVVPSNTTKVLGNPNGIAEPVAGVVATTQVRLISSGTPAYSVSAW